MLFVCHLFNITKIISIKNPLHNCVHSPELKALIIQDINHTFQKIGVLNADKLTDKVLRIISEEASLSSIEKKLFDAFKEIRDGTRQSVIDLLERSLSQRAEIIYNQVKDDIVGQEGKVLDFGCGDGQVTKLLANDGCDIEGFDPIMYQPEETNSDLRIFKFDGTTILRSDGYYQTILATNVFHHESNNQKCLEEIDRLLLPGGRIVVIETVPLIDDDPSEWERTWFNDWFYNRPFHPFQDIPVPGTYETPDGWKKRFKAMGWKIVSEEDLGMDIPVISDRHYKFILEKS